MAPQCACVRVSPVYLHSMPRTGYPAQRGGPRREFLRRGLAQLARDDDRSLRVARGTNACCGVCHPDEESAGRVVGEVGRDDWLPPLPRAAFDMCFCWNFHFGWLSHATRFCLWGRADMRERNLIYYGASLLASKGHCLIPATALGD